MGFSHAEHPKAFLRRLPAVVWRLGPRPGAGRPFVNLAASRVPRVANASRPQLQTELLHNTRATARGVSQACVGTSLADLFGEGHYVWRAGRGASIAVGGQREEADRVAARPPQTGCRGRRRPAAPGACSSLVPSLSLRSPTRRRHPQATLQLSDFKGFTGEPSETRTLDPRIKSPLLYQLS